MPSCLYNFQSIRSKEPAKTHTEVLDYRQVKYCKLIIIITAFNLRMILYLSKVFLILYHSNALLFYEKSLFLNIIKVLHSYLNNLLIKMYFSFHL